MLKAWQCHLHTRATSSFNNVNKLLRAWSDGFGELRDLGIRRLCLLRGELQRSPDVFHSALHHTSNELSRQLRQHGRRILRSSRVVARKQERESLQVPVCRGGRGFNNSEPHNGLRVWAAAGIHAAKMTTLKAMLICALSIDGEQAYCRSPTEYVFIKKPSSMIMAGL